MSTGFTYRVAEGTEPSFESFVLRCSTAMGACIMQRDSNQEFPSIADIKINLSYHKEQMEKALKDTDVFILLTHQELQDRMIIEFNGEREHYIQSIQKNLATKERYQEMLGKVKVWNPPTSEHVGLKDFMIEQLTSSLEFDSSDYYERALADLKEPNILDLEGYRTKKLEELWKTYHYHKEKYDRECERNENRVQWIPDLFDNLGVDVVEDKVVPRG